MGIYFLKRVPLLLTSARVPAEERSLLHSMSPGKGKFWGNITHTGRGGKRANEAVFCDKGDTICDKLNFVNVTDGTNIPIEFSDLVFV